nr:uncharacterized protein LOC115265198 [Aedes albopictus]
MLLGNEWFLKLLLPGEITFDDKLPVLRETQFGWVVGGVFEEGAVSDGAVYSHTVTMDELSQSIQRFWEVEDVADVVERSSEEEECEEHFKATHRRDASGRYIVELPLKESVSELGDSRPLALRRFHALERKLSQHPDLKKQYQDFMDEYESLGHCKEVNVSEDPSGIIKWYLPHHAVQSIQRFWEVEDVADVVERSSEEEECEEHFKATHRRDASGRYIVELPLKESPQPAEVRDSSSTQLREKQHVMQATATARKDHAKEEWAQKEENSYPQAKLLFAVRPTC